MNPKDELNILENAMRDINSVAKSMGLDFYDMFFEICPADIIYTFGAYGMPTRFSHWTFGKAYHKMKTQYDYNLGRIYEMVINSDPCYAFLLEGNSIIQNKLVMAHVLGHCDFFKNNAYFKHTSRDMVESMAAASERFREYEFKYGRKEVELFIDAAISIQEHIEPRLLISKGERKKRKKTRRGNTPPLQQPSSYDDLWGLDRSEEKQEVKNEAIKKFPARPEKDLMLFVIEHSKELRDWQKDILSVLRQEMYYFWPQLETKIMNEGWACYWHLRIMRELDLDENETIEFAKMHSGIIQTSRTSINPYTLGLKIFEDIEKRWNKPSDEEKKRYNRCGNEGREKVFEVRATENDVSFLRNYLTKELIEDMDLYLYKKWGNEWRVEEKDWKKIRDGLVNGLTNGSFPYITVQDGDYGRNGELYLKHHYEGLELDIYYIERTIPYLYSLWGHSVHLETVLGDKAILFSFDGKNSSKKIIQ